MDLAALAISLAALAVAIYAARSANRSAHAAEDSAADARRSADADQRMAALAEEEHNRFDVDWPVEWVKGQMYRVTNQCSGTVRDATVEGPMVMRVQGAGDLKQGESIRFIHAPSWQKQGDVTVSWRYPEEHGGERDSRRLSMPG